MGDRVCLFSGSSGSDSDGSGAAAPVLPPLRFQKKRVREFISQLQQPNKLGPTFFSDDDVKEWDSWNNEVPESLGEVQPRDHPLPLMFPAKCIQVSDGAGSSGAGGHPARAELISYANARGRSLSVVQRQRQFEQTAIMTEDDLPVGSRVALKKGSSINANGYRTPFYIGEVLSHSRASNGTVEALLVHYLMPSGAYGLFCDDINRSWKLACVAEHVYSGRCKLTIDCRAAATKAGTDGEVGKEACAGAD